MVLTQHLRDDGPVASSIHWKTRPGPRYRACLRLTRDDTVQVSVVDRSDHAVRVLASARPLKGGDTPHCFDWDGLDSAGQPLPARPVSPPARPSGRRSGRRLWRAIDRPPGRGALVSEALEVAGCLAAAGAVSTALLVSEARIRAAGLLVAMAIATRWSRVRAGTRSRVCATIRWVAGTIVAAAVVLAVGGAAMVRWPILLPLLVVATLPFRIRLRLGRAGGKPARPALRDDRGGRYCGRR